jgi:hypothetical protein
MKAAMMLLLLFLGKSALADEIRCSRAPSIVPDLCHFLPGGEEPPSVDTLELYAVQLRVSLRRPGEEIIIFARTPEDGWIMSAFAYDLEFGLAGTDSIVTDMREVWIEGLEHGPDRAMAWLNADRLDAMMATDHSLGDVVMEPAPEGERRLGRVCLDGSSLAFIVFRDGQTWTNARHECAGATVIDEFAQRLLQDALHLDPGLRPLMKSLYLER